MGNSGSMSGLSGYEEGYHHHPGYHHHHQRYHDAMRGEAASGMSASWMDSYQRDHHRRAGPRHGDHDQQQQQQQQQIKVLPDIPGKVAKLRSTNNGNILHAGGTISKNNQALQRSKSISSPTYQQHQQQQPASFSECDEDLEMSSLQPRLLMQRSRTQLNLLPPGVSGGGGARSGRPRNAHGYHHEDEGHDAAGARQPARYGEPSANATAESLNHRKRFGSEPDLRLSLLPQRSGPQPEQPAGGGPRNPKTAQSKIMKGKNKKKAPVPPVMEKRDSNKEPDQRQRIIAYSPMRKPGPDANTSTLPSSSDGSSFNVAATRKLRLFKTRAETKKTPTIAKLPEASDAKFPGKPGTGGGGFMRTGIPVQPGGAAPHVLGAHLHPAEEDKLSGALDQLSPRPNPATFFRREKTFDAGLLGLERQRAIEPRPATKPTMSPPLSRRKSIVKSLLEQDATVKATPVRVDVKPRQQIGTPAESYQRKLALAEAQRKQQSAAAASPPAPITDFQKELQLATRRKTGPEVAQTGQARVRAGGDGPPTSQATSRFQLKAKASPNALVITVEPAAQEAPECAEPTDGGGKQDARDSPPPPTPPPPPPPPKTSFYFGMRDDRPQREPPRRFSSGAPQSAPKAVEARVADDSGSERDAHAHDSDGQSVEEIGHTQMELIDQFAASLLNSSLFRSSESVASSEADLRTGGPAGGSVWDETDGPGQQEIALKLRPTLPRKQFDIPRFSPAAAWRLLTTEDEFGRDAPTEVLGPERKCFLRGLDQELDQVPEDRIQRVYREPVPGLQDNKSGDSGISGDAGILADIGQDAMLTASSGKEDARAGDTSPESGAPLHKGGAGGGGSAANGGWSSSALLLMPWTPQQDLDDDDDDDEDDEEVDEDEEDDTTTGSGSEPRRQLLEDGRGIGDARTDFSSKGHLFSLSLPRENHLSIYNVEAAEEKVEKHVFNSLQKFRKSVSGAFKSEESGGPLDSNDSNWFLGRLDTKLGGGPGPGGGTDKRSKLLPDGRERDGLEPNGGTTVAIGPIAQSKHSSIGFLVSGKHMMYLPKEPTKLHHQASGKQDENNNRRTYHNQNGTGDRHDKPNGTAHRDVPARTATDKENLQDPVPVAAATTTTTTTTTKAAHATNGTKGAAAANGAEFESFPVKISNRRNHRFTFQSTIRQIEKRRVAEKLSREAEIKEAMRLSELEAMRRVEEEFQKKRAREKASIRHQLRLFSMENHPDHDGDGEQDSTGETKRSDPDGDSLPHQSASGRGGLYRKKEFASIERQYKRGGTGAAGTTADDLDADDIDLELEKPVAAVGGRRRYGDEDDGDDDGASSSLGYVDTRTPYISRIIQAKSSKSYGGKK
uniref:Uncharacterized protein n=1 Tax=Anopheles dirus TaxID=7168 RepID=A0A182N8E3_9DIPT